MKTKIITIKETPETTPQLIEKILTVALSHGILFDDYAECGLKLGYFINESQYSIDQFCVFVIGKSSDNIRKFISELIIWGKDYDCPDCGCELDYVESVIQCLNTETCGYWVNYEPDPDRYRDDCKFQFDFTNRLN